MRDFFSETLNLMAALVVAMGLSTHARAEEPILTSKLGSPVACSNETGTTIYPAGEERLTYTFKCVYLIMFDFNEESGPRTLWKFYEANGDEIGFVGTNKHSDNTKIPDILVVDLFNNKKANSDKLLQANVAGVCGISRKVKEVTCNIVWHQEDVDNYGSMNLTARYNKFESLMKQESKWH